MASRSGSGPSEKAPRNLVGQSPEAIHHFVKPFKIN